MSVRHAATPFLIAFSLLCASAWAQFPTLVPSGENTIYVMSSGSAQAPADWIDVKLQIQSNGPGAESAVSINRDDCERAKIALVNNGIAAESVSFTAPRISGGGIAQMGRQDDGNKWFVTSTLTVRINEFEEDTVYEMIGRIIDTAAGAGNVEPDAILGVQQMMMQTAGITEFGVNDQDKLDEEAVSNALERAEKTAKLAAAKSGKKLGAIGSLQMFDLSGGGGIMNVMKMFDEPSKPGFATTSIMLGVTYKIE